MTVRPLLFSGPMIRALLAGRKTTSRRILNPQPMMLPGVNPDFSQLEAHKDADGVWRIYGDESASEPFKVRFAVGDLLWVRESCCAHWGNPPIGAPVPLHPRRIVDCYVRQSNGSFARASDDEPIFAYYRADNDTVPLSHLKWMPSIHMPRWASRITLKVTTVKVEPLNKITEADAIAEGVRTDRVGAGTFIGREGPGHMVTPWLTATEAFADIWASIHGPDAWSANPWVVAIAFTVIKANVSAVHAETARSEAA